MNLTTWTTEYIKHRHAFTQRLKSVREEGRKIIFELTDGKDVYYVYPQLSDELLKEMTTAEPKTFVCENTRQNLDFVISHWKKLITPVKLVFLFVNLKTGGKWLLNPRVHNSVADEASLEQGLQAMFNACEGRE